MYTLYIYDHCPYCVKARMIFGLKGTPVRLNTLLNDDVDTPTNMIGQKMVPILEKEEGSYMPESMDIIHFIDQSDGSPIVKPSLHTKELDGWFDEIRGITYRLAMPRWVEAPLDEFKTKGAKAYFTEKKEAMIGPFAEHMESSAELKQEVDAKLEILAPLIKSPQAVHGELTEDDFHLFAVLRSLSIVKGLHYPKEVEEYRQKMAKQSGVPLHDEMAI